MDDISRDTFFEDYRVFWGHAMTRGDGVPPAVAIDTLITTSQDNIDELPRAFIENSKNHIRSLFGPLCEEYVRDVTVKVAKHIPRGLAFFYATTLYLEVPFWKEYLQKDGQYVIDKMKRIMQEQKDKRVAAMPQASEGDRKLDLSGHVPYIEKILR